MNTLRRLGLILAGMLLSAAGYSQSLLDGVRLSEPQLGTGTRGFGMGGAMVAAANDYTALDWNPAALTLLEFSEFGISLWHSSLETTRTMILRTRRFHLSEQEYR
jgi:hypothetical protein